MHACLSDCLVFVISHLQAAGKGCNAGQPMNVIPFKLAAETGGDTTLWDFPLLKIK